MKLLNGLTDFFNKLLKFIIILLVMLFLGVIIKWQVDAIYVKSTTRTDSNFSFIDEIKKTKNDILSIKNGQPVKTITKAQTPKDDAVNITITENTSVDDIAKMLMDAKLIKDIDAFKVMVNDMGLYNSFVAGTYQFNKDNKILDTLMTLTNSTYKEFDITIAEGENSAAVGKKLADIGAIRSVEAFDAQCKSLGVENSFKPGSYTIATPIKVVRIIEKLTGQKLDTN